MQFCRLADDPCALGQRRKVAGCQDGLCVGVSQIDGPAVRYQVLQCIQPIEHGIAPPIDVAAFPTIPVGAAHLLVELVASCPQSAKLAAHVGGGRDLSPAT